MEPIAHWKVLMKLAKEMVEFPNPLICKHHVAATLLSLIEESGGPIFNDLAKAVVDGDDENALILIDKWFKSFDLRNSISGK